MKPGYIILLAALGMMLGLTAVDVAKLHSWYDIQEPPFISNVMIHFASVITAFVGGKLLPTDSKDGGRRVTDPPRKD